MTPPGHIQLRRYRTTPTHLDPFRDKLQGLAFDQFNAVERFAENAAQMLEQVYSQGFEDGWAAAMLEQEKDDGEE